MMRYGTLVWSGGGAGGGIVQSPEMGASGGQGEWEICEREEAEGRMGECGLGTGAKETHFFFISANAESESLTQAWGLQSQISASVTSGCVFVTSEEEHSGESDLEGPPAAQLCAVVGISKLRS